MCKKAAKQLGMNCASLSRKKIVLKFEYVLVAYIPVSCQLLITFTSPRPNSNESFFIGRAGKIFSMKKKEMGIVATK